jgi:DeoR family suf operon transcriptional repressor
MQPTRERILTILKETHEATVDELSEELGLTPVTIRHHLDILRGDGLVEIPRARRRKAPGRPQYLYALTLQGAALFPRMYDQLAGHVLAELSSLLDSAGELKAAMDRIAERIASQASPPDDDFDTRIEAAVDFLEGLGYMARLERDDSGDCRIRIINCPYESVARIHHVVCDMDLALITRLLGRAPEREACAAHRGKECVYLIKNVGK